MSNIDYKLLLKLTQDIPSNLDKTLRKEKISSDMRKSVIDRDGYQCKLCGKFDKFGYKEFGIDGSLEIHHIIPNGESTIDNLVILCLRCHMLIHLILWLDGKWKYIRR